MTPTRSKEAIKGFVILRLAFRQEDKQWLGECLELGTATYARSLKQAHKELVELVTLHLNALEDAGERERFFREKEIKFYNDDEPPSEVNQCLPVDEELYVHAHSFPIGTFA